MKIAHLILTHKNPRQTERLINALEHPDFHFYIHVDKKTNQLPFEYLAERNDVSFIKNRTKIYWAGYGTIQATLNGFEEILKQKFDYINVISGQDFPLKSSDQIHNYIHGRKGTEFITCESIETEWTEAAPRIKNYHLINWKIPGKYRLEKIVNKILPQRKFPLEYEIVGRANWFTITTSACEYILQILKQHPEIIRYFKYCWGADEFIFSTILFNSAFRERIVENLVYVDWTGQSKGHPRILETADYNKLCNTPKLFARKFDMTQDPKIIDLLEEKIKNTIPDA